MIESTVKRGILVTVLVMITCILGVVASLNIPVQMIPDLEVRTISVRTGWPGPLSIRGGPRRRLW